MAAETVDVLSKEEEFSLFMKEAVMDEDKQKFLILRARVDGLRYNLRTPGAFSRFTSRLSIEPDWGCTQKQCTNAVQQMRALEFPEDLVEVFLETQVTYCSVRTAQIAAAKSSRDGLPCVPSWLCVGTTFRVPHNLLTSDPLQRTTKGWYSTVVAKSMSEDGVTIVPCGEHANIYPWAMTIPLCASLWDKVGTVPRYMDSQRILKSNGKTLRFDIGTRVVCNIFGLPDKARFTRGTVVNQSYVDNGIVCELPPEEYAAPYQVKLDSGMGVSKSGLVFIPHDTDEYIRCVQDADCFVKDEEFQCILCKNVYHVTREYDVETVCEKCNALCIPMGSCPRKAEQLAQRYGCQKIAVCDSFAINEKACVVVCLRDNPPIKFVGKGPIKSNDLYKGLVVERRTEDNMWIYSVAIPQGIIDVKRDNLLEDIEGYTGSKKDHVRVALNTILLVKDNSEETVFSPKQLEILRTFGVETTFTMGGTSWSGQTNIDSTSQVPLYAKVLDPKSVELDEKTKALPWAEYFVCIEVEFKYTEDEESIVLPVSRDHFRLLNPTSTQQSKLEEKKRVLLRSFFRSPSQEVEEPDDGIASQSVDELTDWIEGRSPGSSSSGSSAASPNKKKKAKEKERRRQKREKQLRREEEKKKAKAKRQLDGKRQREEAAKRKELKQQQRQAERQAEEPQAQEPQAEERHVDERQAETKTEQATQVKAIATGAQVSDIDEIVKIISSMRVEDSLAVSMSDMLSSLTTELSLQPDTSAREVVAKVTELVGVEPKGSWKERVHWCFRELIGTKSSTEQCSSSPTASVPMPDMLSALAAELSLSPETSAREVVAKVTKLIGVKPKGSWKERVHWCFREVIGTTSRTKPRKGTPLDASAEHTSVNSTEPPNYMLCPISSELMDDPVSTLVGNTYDKVHILAWFRTHKTDPLTNATLDSKRLVPNNSLRSQIQEWRETHGHKM